MSKWINNIKITPNELKDMQSLPLSAKIKMAEDRIHEWVEFYGVDCIYIAFSGGKDSTVLLNIVRKLYPNTLAVFSDIGLEYPEIRSFVKTMHNVTWIKPKYTFKYVIEKYGYPVVSKKVAHSIRVLQNPTDKNQASVNLYLFGIKKDGTKALSYKLANKWLHLVNSGIKISDKCCYHLKKGPFGKYERKTGKRPLIGNMASDSNLREFAYLESGCNIYYSVSPKSMPLSVWLEKDIWEYIRLYDLSYSEIYGMGEERTGCMFCMFGVHLDSAPNKFQRMKNTHPKYWKFCMETLKMRHVLDIVGIKYE